MFVEQYDAGWSATVDGQPAPILTANLVMRAVPIPDGSHRIEMAYHTPGLRGAVLVSIVGLLGFAILLAASVAGVAKSRSRKRDLRSCTHG